jgi:hypothetical protein
MPLTPLIHITAAYSNAVLLAILPHISDCAKQLDLPIPQPITASQVSRFATSSYENDVGGGVWLTNGYWFNFSLGYVEGFRSSTNWFSNQNDNWDDLKYLKRYIGKDNMTTNEAVALARSSFVKLGYKLADFNLDAAPTRLEGPYDTKKLGHIPFCRVEWDNPAVDTDEKRAGQISLVQFDIDLQRKQIVGMGLSSTNFWRPNPQIDVVPETELDYRKRIQGKMFVRSNAPIHFVPNNRTNTAVLLKDD